MVREQEYFLIRCNPTWRSVDSLGTSLTDIFLYYYKIIFYFIMGQSEGKSQLFNAVETGNVKTCIAVLKVNTLQ